MLMYITKRDGRKVPFNVEKIVNAIFKAAKAVGGTDYEEATRIAEEVCQMIEEKYKDSPTVEQVQDLVEKVLIERGHAQTAKAYILYRYDRNRSREMDTNLMRVLNELTFNSAKESVFPRRNFMNYMF